jgi:hypothetical protein
MDDHPVCRRTVCRGIAAAAGTTGLAGCLGGDSDTEAEEIEVPPALSFGSIELNPAFPFKLVVPESRYCITEVQYHDPESGNVTHWHFQPVTVPYQTEYTTGLLVADPHKEPVPLGPDEELQVDVRFADETASRPFTVDVQGDSITFSGQRRAGADIVFDVERDGTRLWSTPPLTIEVVDESDLWNKCSPGELPAF